MRANRISRRLNDFCRYDENGFVNPDWAKWRLRESEAQDCVMWYDRRGIYRRVNFRQMRRLYDSQSMEVPMIYSDFAAN